MLPPGGPPDNSKWFYEIIPVISKSFSDQYNQDNDNDDHAVANSDIDIDDDDDVDEVDDENINDVEVDDVDDVDINDDEVNEVDDENINEDEIHPLPSLLYWLQVKRVHHWKLKYFTEATIILVASNSCFGETSFCSRKVTNAPGKQETTALGKPHSPLEKINKCPADTGRLLWSESKSKCSTIVIWTAAAQQTQSFTDAK